MTEDKKQEFLGSIVAKMVVDKTIGKVVEKALDKVADSRSTSMSVDDVPAAKEIVTAAVAKEAESRFDHQTNNEFAGKSRNVWATFFGVIAAIDLVQKMWFDGLPNSINDYASPTVIILSFGAVMWSRYISKKPLGE